METIGLEEGKPIITHYLERKPDFREVNPIEIIIEEIARKTIEKRAPLTLKEALILLDKLFKEYSGPIETLLNEMRERGILLFEIREGKMIIRNKRKLMYIYGMLLEEVYNNVNELILNLRERTKESDPRKKLKLLLSLSRIVFSAKILVQNMWETKIKPDLIIRMLGIVLLVIMRDYIAIEKLEDYNTRKLAYILREETILLKEINKITLYA